MRWLPPWPGSLTRSPPLRETAHIIECGGMPMVGILHRPDQPATRAVLMVTAGGPQYRVGGHRQQILWARSLCEQGLAVLRFDQRGKGDSWGPFKDFVDLDDDIRCALDHMAAQCPTLEEVVLWGECNAASAILYYAYRDARVTGAVLLNPWLHTEGGAAKATLKHYYWQRLRQPSFWRKLFSGRFNPVASLTSVARLLKAASKSSAKGRRDQSNTTTSTAAISRDLPLPEGLLLGVQRFKGRLLIVLSGRDPVAHEYQTVIAGSQAWQQALAGCQTVTHLIAIGDHTFSSAEQRNMVLSTAQDWLNDLPTQNQSVNYGAPTH